MPAAWFQAFGMPSGTKYSVGRATLLTPIIRSTNPLTNDNLALYVAAPPLDIRLPWNDVDKTRSRSSSGWSRCPTPRS